VLLLCSIPAHHTDTHTPSHPCTLLTCSTHHTLPFSPISSFCVCTPQALLAPCSVITPPDIFATVQGRYVVRDMLPPVVKAVLYFIYTGV
jgi:hypothetical protein